MLILSKHYYEEKLWERVKEYWREESIENGKIQELIDRLIKALRERDVSYERLLI